MVSRDLVVSGVSKIRNLAIDRNWNINNKNNLILHRNTEKLIFARFASELYKINYDKCFRGVPDYIGMYSVFLKRLDGFILERIRESYTELKGVPIIFYNSENASRRDTIKVEHTAIEYII